MFQSHAQWSVHEIMWDTVKNRTDALETAFDQTKLFRKFT